MTTWGILVIGIVILIIYLRVKSSFSKYKAALNVLLAKYTYENLDRNTQEKVILRTMQILSGGGISNAGERLETMNNKERYGFFALAMAELGIQPALSGYDWHYVKNPFVVLIKADNAIWMAKNQLRKSHGVEIDI